MMKARIDKAQQARIDRHLGALVKYNGQIMTNKALVHLLMGKGAAPVIKKMYTAAAVFSCKHSASGPKNVYCLENDDNGLFVTISKTMYDFALKGVRS